MRARVRERSDGSHAACVSACVFERARACACACVRARARVCARQACSLWAVVHRRAEGRVSAFCTQRLVGAARRVRVARPRDAHLRVRERDGEGTHAGTQARRHARTRTHRLRKTYMQGHAGTQGHRWK
eukprot:2638459-Pleurochrysis_carterae.AAC.1